MSQQIRIANRYVMSESIKEIDKTSECSICFCDFDKPKQLPCQHTFCLKCLKTYCKGKMEGDKKPCPLCRTEFYIPRGGVEKLPKNQFKMRLVLMNGMSEEEKAACKCEPCTEIGEYVAAQSYCIECRQYLCLRCKRLHSATSSLKVHNVVEIEETSGEEKLHKKKVSNCSVHNGKELEFLCCDCNIPLCSLCHFENHTTHNCKLLQELANQKKEEFTKDENMVKRCHSEGSGQITALQREREHTIQQAEGAVNSLKEAYEKVITLFTLRRNQLLAELETIKTERLSEINQQRYLDQMRCEEFNSFLTHSRMMMERGTDCEIMRVADELHKRAEELIKSQDERNTQQLPECFINFIAPPLPTLEDAVRFIDISGLSTCPPSTTTPISRAPVPQSTSASRECKPFPPPLPPRPFTLPRNNAESSTGTEPNTRSAEPNAAMSTSGGLTLPPPLLPLPSGFTTLPRSISGPSPAQGARSRSPVPNRPTSMPPSDAGVSYIRWGRTTCLAGNILLYKGYMVGNHHLGDGNGGNFLCASDNPLFVRGNPGFQDWSGRFTGVEFEINAGFERTFLVNNLPSGVLHNQDAVCARCHIPDSSDVFVLPGRPDCDQSNYELQYKGFLVSEMNYAGNAANEYICVDESSEGRPGGTGNDDQAEIFPVQVECGSLPCSPYANGMEATCAVCSY